MSAAYASAAHQILPHVRLVIDRFRLVQLTNNTVNLVRRAATAKAPRRRARKADPEYGIKRRLLRKRKELTDAKFTDMCKPTYRAGRTRRRHLHSLDREGGTAQSADP